MKKIIVCLCVITVLWGNGFKAYASKANDCVYVSKKAGVIKSINLTNHFIFVDGYSWSQLPYETKQTLVYCFAQYMEEKAKDKGGFVDIKDYNSGEKYAIGGAFGSKVYK